MYTGIYFLMLVFAQGTRRPVAAAIRRYVLYSSRSISTCEPNQRQEDDARRITGGAAKEGKMAQLIDMCQRRGFVFQGSDIYGRFDNLIRVIQCRKFCSDDDQLSGVYILKVALLGRMITDL